MEKKETQNKQILNYLIDGGKITPLLALNKFGSFRLSARIFDLREKGHNIKKTIINYNGKKFAEYYLLK